MKLDFAKSVDGLIPAIIQDSDTKNVLMLGYMNEEALKKTQKENRVTFYSRSKKRLWTKGEESGNFLEVKEVLFDCDQDTILVKVKPSGQVCHTGSDTCFDRVNRSENFLVELERLIAQRRDNPAAESYVSSLFASGMNKIIQKVGEEAVELVIEAKDDNGELFKNEAADLMFHYLVLLSAKGFSISDVIEVLQKRNSRLPDLEAK